MIKILKRNPDIEDLKYLAMISKDFHTFHKAVTKSQISISVIKEAGDLESFYYEHNGTEDYDPPMEDIYG